MKSRARYRERFAIESGNLPLPAVRRSRRNLLIIDPLIPAILDAAAAIAEPGS